MSHWFDVEGVGGWRREDVRYNAVDYCHPKTDEKLVVLRFHHGPDTTDPWVSYVVRVISRDSESWIDLYSTQTRNELQSKVKKYMRDIPDKSIRHYSAGVALP